MVLYIYNYILIRSKVKANILPLSSVFGQCYFSRFGLGFFRSVPFLNPLLPFFFRRGACFQNEKAADGLYPSAAELFSGICRRLSAINAGYAIFSV